jgi:hypothetical protein
MVKRLYHMEPKGLSLEEAINAVAARVSKLAAARRPGSGSK